MDINKKALAQHKKLHGKIEIALKDSLDSREKLSIYYTPGVAAVSSYVAARPELTREYTWLKNNVAIISDGSAVLGLGNIGPYGALPVMEGKAALFKHFAGIDGVPIVLNVHTADEIVECVAAIAPSFGGINLEDISAPKCFEIEERLKVKLSIPLMHDDQHGTAIVVLAGLINATKVTGAKLSDAKIVCAGVGAAGTAVIKLLHKYAQPEIIAVDSQGIVAKSREDLNVMKRALLNITNKKNISGDLAKALSAADIFIGVSAPGLLSKRHIKLMNKDSIIFAMANPTPEIMPDMAQAAGAAIVATGRSDFPNQVNNALAFPGVFRGALDNQVKKITDEHKIAAAEALAALVKNPTAEHIIPSVLNKKVVPAVAKVIC